MTSPTGPNKRVQPIQKLRAARGWSLKRLSGIAGVDLKPIRAIERGQPDGYLGMRLRTILRLSIALGCAPSDIFPMLKARPKHGRFDAVLVSEDVIRTTDEAIAEMEEEERRSKL